jgi:hypothetical protein
VEIGIPQITSLSQNYPNPSNPKSKIDFWLPHKMKIRISVYDITGRELFVLIDNAEDAGYRTIEFDGSNLASGIYFYRMISENFEAVKKLVLVK